MAPRKSMVRAEATEHAPAPASSIAVQRVRTGARLGPARALVGIAAVTFGLRYVVWQVSIAPTTVLGSLFVTAEIASLLLLALTVGILLDRGTRMPPGAPSGTLDVFVTVCGEPPALVESALRAAVAIEYPHRTIVLNDGRFAGEKGWEAIDQLARDLGCEVITRTTGARGKAGNLNHALAFSTADFVATIDADHRADGDLALRTLGWFADPGVAFVTTRQRFVDVSGVLYNREDFFYSAIQPARDASGCAISCGNGVVYRRVALDRIGGFSEWNIVEDLHTSYRLHAAGWTSVYEREPVTTGLAPPTAGEFAHQRTRWALDNIRLLVLDSPVLRSGLTMRQRLHYLQTTGSFVLTVPFLVYLVGPPMYILGRVRAAGGSTVADYLGHALPFLGLMVALFVSILGVRGALQAFRSALFNSGFAFVAIALAVARRRPSGVTRKGAPRRSSWLLAPQILAATLLITALAVAVTDGRPGVSPVAVAWAGILAFALVGPLAAISTRPVVVRRSALGAQASVAVLVVVAVTGASRSSTERLPIAPVADPRSADVAEFAVATSPINVPAPPAPTTATVSGTESAPPRPPPTSRVTTTSVLTAPLEVPPVGAFLGIASEGIQAEPGAVDAWSAANAGARPAIVHWFQHWGSGENRFRADWVRNVSATGAVPMITWEPWAKPEGLYADPQQADFRLEAIIAGQYDTYIRTWAAGAAAYGGPLLIRFMHEFNGEWYPWSIGLHGQTPEQFIAAWRHVHAIFEEEGASNVSWIWSTIRGFSDPAPAYPGDDVVDWVAATVLNTANPAFGGWLAYGFLVGDLYDQLAGYAKPVMLAEIATAQGGDAATWWADTFATVRRDNPGVRAVVVFDMPYDEVTDYQLPAEASAVIAAATRSGWFAVRP